MYRRLPSVSGRLERLARVPHRGIAPMSPELTPEAAARPSEQIG